MCAVQETQNQSQLLLSSNDFFHQSPPSGVTSPPATRETTNLGQKCDERTPTCSNCTKHSITCDFSIDPRHGTASSLERAQRETSDGQGLRNDSTTLASTLTSCPMADDTQPAAFNMRDLELLHHFTTETCFTLSNQPQSHRLWQGAVPREGFQHKFLMHGILAVAALHLSCLKPEKQETYRRTAAQHQDLALSLFRSVMPIITESNCHAIFALSSLIVVFAFAAPRGRNSIAFTDDSEEPTGWLSLIRGVRSILISVWPWVKNGGLGGLLPDGIEQPQPGELSEPADMQINKLLHLCEDASGGPEVLAAYRETVDGLKTCYLKLYTKAATECEVSIAFLWPTIIPQKFVTMLNSRAPEALIILAHYCVILQHLDKYWWKSGWTVHLLDNIYRVLDQPWHAWMEWPTSVIQREHGSWRIVRPAE